MINVKLLALTQFDQFAKGVELPSEKEMEMIMSFAAKGCYEGSEPEIGKTIDIEKRIFNTGHHTIPQHICATFFIEGATISDYTFGLHLTHPFYDTSQRSGRYCSKMFTDPDIIEKVSGFIKLYWPSIKDETLQEICDYIAFGSGIYKGNIREATEHAESLIKKERPRATEKYIHDNAGKFAQEQMRVFLPIILPTAATTTINLSTLFSLYQAAWTPTMRDIVEKMIALVLHKNPGLKYMFRKKIDNIDWMPGIGCDKTRILYEPEVCLVGVEYNGFMPKFPEAHETHPINHLPFSPYFMENNGIKIKSVVELSIATMGQDQRHRTIKRTLPIITGNFYLPPVAALCNMKNLAIELMERYKNITRKLKNDESLKTLATAIAPYGATASYYKEGDLNAVIHEMGKRGCWTAQQEIYNAAVGLREAISEKYHGYQAQELTKIFLPGCLRTGKCTEGDRYCGRIINQEPHFPERKI